MLPWERFGGTTNAAPAPQPNTFVTPTSGPWSRFQPAAVTPAPQAPSIPGGFGATEQAPDPFAIREQRAQEAMAPAPMDLNERRQKVGKLRAKYIDYRELWDFLDQLEADEALDYFDLEKEFLYAVGEIKDQRKQQEQGAKLAEKAAKDEERRYEKFRKEQQKQDEKVLLSQRQEAEKQEKKAIDAEKFGIQQQTKLTAEQIKAGAKTPSKAAPKSAFLPWEQERMAQEFIAQDEAKQFQEKLERETAGITDPAQAQIVADNVVKIESLREALPRLPAGQQMQAKALLAKMIARKTQAQMLETNQDVLFWQNATGAAKAAGRAMRETALPTTVGALTGFGAAKAVASRHPAVGIVLGLGAGIAGALGAAKVQEKVQKSVLGEEDFARYQQKLAEDREKYPTAVFAGEQLPSLLVGKVNAKELKSAVSAAKAIITGRNAKGLSNEQIVSLYNAAFGGTLGAGQEVARGLKEGDIKWTEVAAAAILNSVINDTRFGAPVKAKADTLSITPDAKVDLDKEAIKALDAFAGSIKDTEAAAPVTPPARPTVEPTTTPTPREATRQVEEEIARMAAEPAPARLVPEVTSVRVREATYNFRDGKWYREGSTVPVKATRLLDDIEKEVANAVQIRETETLPMGEGAGGRPPVDREVREQAPPVEGKVPEAEVTPPGKFDVDKSISKLKRSGITEDVNDNSVSIQADNKGFFVEITIDGNRKRLSQTTHASIKEAQGEAERYLRGEISFTEAPRKQIVEKPEVTTPVEKTETGKPKLRFTGETRAGPTAEDQKLAANLGSRIAVLRGLNKATGAYPGETFDGIDPKQIDEVRDYMIKLQREVRPPTPEAPRPPVDGQVREQGPAVKAEDQIPQAEGEVGDQIRRELNAAIKSGDVVVSKQSPAWGPVELKSKDGRVELRVTEGEEGFGKMRSGQAKHEVLVDGKVIYEGKWTVGRSPSQDVINAFSNAVKMEKPIAQPSTSAKTKIVTDQAEVQRIKNSITEGELILKSGRKVSGAKMSDSELNMVLRSVNNSRAKIGLPPTDVVPKFTTPPAQPTIPEAPVTPPVEAAPMDVRAEAARKAKEGAVDVSGFAKLRQGFARMRENLKAQNAADRDLLAAREGEAAADRLARETEANLNATRALLRQRGQDDAQVARDMNLAIRAEGSLTVDGKTYSKENITDLGYMEARNLAKAAGITLPEGATKSQVIKALLDRTTPDMTPEQFATKYGLGGADKDRWLQNFKDAEDLAAKLGVRLDEAGLSGLGQYVSENVGYATRRYLRNIKEGFEPTPEARTKAEDIVAQSVAKRVQNLGTRASKLGIDDLNTYLNARTDEEAVTVIRNLAPAQREEANDIRKAYQNLRSAVTVVSKDIGSGAVKIDVDPQQVRNIASTIVDDMLQPPRNLADSANAGAGNAINSLLRRDLKPVFRELFGEIDDPAIVAAASRENQARNVARFTALADMAKKSGFIETDAMKAKEKGWVRLASDQKIGGTVSDYDRRRFGVLAGSYAPESVKAMLTNQDYHAIKLPEVLRSVERAVNKLAGIQRGSTVNLRPKSWIRDIITNVTTFAGGSGDLADPVTFGKHYKDAMRVIGKHAKAKVTKDNKALGETERFFRMLADKGIFRAQTSSYWDDVSDAITGSGKLATAWKTIGEGKSMFADMPVKYAAYMTRLEKAKSWGWSDDKAREWAMEGLTRHYDNRDAVPKTFRDMSRKGLMPDYLTFKYSSIRARALQTKDIFKDLQRKDIPVEYRAKMLSSYLASLAAQPIVAGTRVGGKVAKYGAVLSTLYKTSEMLSPEAEQVDDENLDGANRYFSPRYAQQDGKVYFTDTKDGKKRLTTFSLTGAITASPFEDAIVGSLQAGVNPDLDNDLVSKLFEATIGSDVPMLWNSFSEFVSGEPLLAKYDNPGFFNALANRRDALKKATLLRKRGQEEAAIEQEKIGKEYGMEALMRVAGTADIFLGPLVGAAERGRTLKAEQVRRERRMTEATEAGPRKAKGYGPEEGRPTEEYRPTLETVDIAFGQVLPFNVRIENIEDARARVYSRAANLRAGMRETSKETEEAQFEASTETKREARKTILDAYMEPWVRNARTYLSWYGEEDVDARLKDALSKANFSDWEIEYILQFSPPAQEAAPQFGPRAPSFRPPTGP